MTLDPATLPIKNVQTGATAELTVLVDGGPLCVAGIWNWKKNCAFPGLYMIYHKRAAAHFGPFYASIPLAEKGMRTALSEIPRDIWAHEPEWYGGQNWISKWIDESLGKAGDLVGGEWETPPEEKKP